MKTARAVGIIVAAGVVIGALVAKYLPDFNFGAGAGSGPATQAVSKSDEQTTVSETKPAPAATVETKSATAETTVNDEGTEPSAPVEAISVLIDGKNYLLRNGSEGQSEFQPATLGEVIKAASATKGEANGIRVRVAEKSSSKETAEQALRESLHDAGISGEAIRWKDKPVDLE